MIAIIRAATKDPKRDQLAAGALCSISVSASKRGRIVFSKLSHQLSAVRHGKITGAFGKAPISCRQ